MDKTRLLRSSLLGLLLLCLFSSGIRAGVIIINGLSHNYKVTPGQVYKGTIELQNTENSPQTLKIYKRDYKFYYTGEAIYDPPASHARSNAQWIDLSPSYMELKGMEKTIIKYEIAVPASAANLTGTLWSVIMVEGVNTIDTSSLDKGFNVQTVIRYAIQIATDIEDTGVANLKFLNVGLNQAENERGIKIDVENVGERLLFPEMTLELFDEKGNAAGVFKSDKRRIYPGTSISFNLDVGEVKPGSYKALLLANCSDEDIFGVNITIDI
ncbi:MAG: hypothetical protein EPO28_18050 [Saprospiraceae bacterium]|nr:MAG: hypothetical protein EPO28_18050 [Saprospiraceae bacterium]